MQAVKKVLTSKKLEDRLNNQRDTRAGKVIIPTSTARAGTVIIPTRVPLLTILKENIIVPNAGKNLNVIVILKFYSVRSAIFTLRITLVFLT